MALTKEERDALPDSSFAVPKKRVLPIADAVHVRMAWDVCSRTKGLSDEERAEARKRILHKAEELGVDTSEWTKIKAMRFDAMSLEMPDEPDHPNKMKFSGVLTRLDEPSDGAPHGANGRRIIVSSAAAEKALGSLLGMGVNLTSDLGGHDPQAKIGIITAATIEGNAIVIEGFIYRADFPKEAIAIKAQRNVLGFSFEADNIEVANISDDPLVITALMFTGAAILRKDKAAYTTTSLAASADVDAAVTDQDEIPMTKEELAALLGESIGAAMKPLNDRLDKIEASSKLPGRIDAAHIRETVEPHAQKLENCAAEMDAAGIGTHPTQGHAALLRRVAGSMRAAAALGQLPTIHRDHDWVYASADTKVDAAAIAAEAVKAAAAAATVAEPKFDAAAIAEAVKAAVAPLHDRMEALGTQVKDVKAASFQASTPPERKTLTPSIANLLARSGVAAPADGSGIDEATLRRAMDAGGVTDPVKRIAFLREAGIGK
jgi:hypothetical protein